jgi:hypothetical protein
LQRSFYQLLFLGYIVRLTDHNSRYRQFNSSEYSRLLIFINRDQGSETRDLRLWTWDQ